MSDERLPTYLWLEAKIRELQAQNMPVYVARRGDRTGGLVLIKVSNLTGQCKLLIQQRDIEGRLQWIPALKQEITDEKSADDYIARASDRDPDLWVVEIEDKEMVIPFSD